jgi:flagellar biosynthesis protein FlhB
MLRDTSACVSSSLVTTLLLVSLAYAVLQVLQEMLDMLRDHENNHHSARLEWIIIYLIMVEVVVGLLEVLGLFGLVGSE